MNKFELHLPGMRGRSIFQQERDEKDQLKNQIYLIRFGHTKALLFTKKCHILSKIPVLGNLTHMSSSKNDFLYDSDRTWCSLRDVKKGEGSHRDQ